MGWVRINCPKFVGVDRSQVARWNYSKRVPPVLNTNKNTTLGKGTCTKPPRRRALTRIPEPAWHGLAISFGRREGGPL